MKKKGYFCVFLFLILLLLHHSSVKADLEGQICDAMYNIFVATDSRLCFKEFEENAAVSLFAKVTSECQAFFTPDGRLIVKLDEGRVPLNTFDRYDVYEDPRFKEQVEKYAYVDPGVQWFKIVTVYGEEVSATFHCSLWRPGVCETLMPEILGKAGSLKFCTSKWQGLEIAKIDPTIMLVDSANSGWPRAVLIDPEFTLRGMPKMVRSDLWRPDTIEHENGRFKIETQAAHKFVTERVPNRFIPYEHLDAVAHVYRTMEVYGNFYVPSSALEVLQWKSCFPLIRLFLEADIKSHQGLEKPFEEFTYFFVPSDPFLLRIKNHPLQINDLMFVRRNAKADPPVLTLFFRRFRKKFVTAAFHCAEERREECEGLFMKILEMPQHEGDRGGLYKCHDEWEGLTLESTGIMVEFKGVGKQALEFVKPLSHAPILFDPVWVKMKLKLMTEDERLSSAIPEDYVIAVMTYVRATTPTRSVVASPTRRVRSRSPKRKGKRTASL